MFWVATCSLALMLVTRSSPATGLVSLIVEVTWPPAFTATSSTPVVPRSCLSYCASRPDWPTRSSPENPVTGMLQLLQLLGGDRLEVAEHLGGVGGDRLGVLDDRLDVGGHAGKRALVSPAPAARSVCGTFCATGIGWYGEPCQHGCETPTVHSRTRSCIVLSADRSGAGQPGQLGGAAIGLLRQAWPCSRRPPARTGSRPSAARCRRGSGPAPTARRCP